MDHDAVLAHPIWQVFGHLADPARLGDWLPAATAIHTAHVTCTTVGVGTRVHIRQPAPRSRRGEPVSRAYRKDDFS
jgi:hypothetical protein